MRGEDELVDRQRGFLTQHDREYLLGQYEEDMSDNYEHQKRYQIRERFRHAMWDFYFMSEHLSDKDKRLLWPEVDNWVYSARNRRQQHEDFEYPEVPFLVKCWRDAIALFVECRILTGIPEDEMLAKWAIEKGVNKAVRRETLRVAQMYREVDATLDWGIGDLYKLMTYLDQVAQEMPREPNAAEEYLLELESDGYLTRNHSVYLYEAYVEG